MKTIYFINSTGGVRVRPSSRQNEIMWEEWYLEHGLHKCSKDEYDSFKQELKKNKEKYGISDDETEEANIPEELDD